MSGRPDFRCVLVSRDSQGQVGMQVTRQPVDRLPSGEVTIAVHWSSVNYKDALAATGHPGVVRSLPHVPGIDAAGTVLASSSPSWHPGEPVVVTGYELGAAQWGGWAEQIRVPASWPVALSDGLTMREAMIWGTAGFTAAQAAQALIDHHVQPGSGAVIVTGATGGVGCLAVRLLSHLGYRVTAVTRKVGSHPWLKSLGATEILSPMDVVVGPDRPLDSARWAGGLDTVGGDVLTSLLRTTSPHGCIAACGMVAGPKLEMTVYPFILRGVHLAGLSSAMAPASLRAAIWSRLGTSWRLDDLDQLATEVALDQLPAVVPQLLSGAHQGRTIVRIGNGRVDPSA